MKSKKLPMIEHKGHKQHKIEHSVDMVDYISNLPDCILHHILSFIPTEEVVKASILSTRWKNLWVSIPNIDIDDTLLHARGIDDRNPLKELDLCLLDAIESVIPESMFNSMSLTTLKIEVEWIKIPSHVSFPCLKTLHLLNVGFMNYDDVNRLLSGCSVLENLFLEECQWIYYLENTVISSSTLSSFTMESIICTDNMPLHFQLFPNLIHLVLSKEVDNYTFRVLMDLLYFCPIIQTFCLSEGFEHGLDLGEDDRIWLLIPICVSNCLKTVTLKNFHANDSEICFLKRVLKYAHVLERMDIWWSKTQLQDVKKETKVRKELETIERRSTDCVIKFS
ncbi:hypothetical protein L2E82_25975 [Cichorium intybus]|uniref:Uncharacterized protein n=1 Tax=Cichorium intybus TaxID=13427 RepID=A0ACB9E5E5_CICIN|nr:hypothetical protein L2E82_25975 [Cichorium intybus]